MCLELSSGCKAVGVAGQSETKVRRDVLTLSPGGSSEEQAVETTTTSAAASKMVKNPRSTGNGVEMERPPRVMPENEGHFEIGAEINGDRDELPL